MNPAALMPDASWMATPSDQPHLATPSEQPHLFLPDEPPFTVEEPHTFSSFVVAPSNRLAHDVAASCARSDPPFDLVYLYGPPGSGKTHLLDALGLQAIAAHPGHQLRVVSAADPNSYEHLNHLQVVDLLLVDDLELLPAWTADLLCAALDRHSLTVLVTSDGPPENLTASGRLRSRLAGGLLAELGYPDAAGRQEILSQWSVRLATPAPDELLAIVAAKIPGDTRALIGSFRRLAAEAALNNEPLTVSFAESCLPVLATRSAPLTPTAILEATARALDFQPDELRSPGRQRTVVAARQIAMFLARVLTDASYPTIGAAFGGRDHTTVIHAVERVGAEIRDNHVKARLAKVLTHLDVDAAQVSADIQRRYPRQPSPPTPTTKTAPTAVTRRPASPRPIVPPPADGDALAAAAHAVIAHVAEGRTGGATTIETLARSSGIPAQALTDAWDRRTRANPNPTPGRPQRRCA
jgi:chromosomal replication initiator protein